MPFISHDTNMLIDLILVDLGEWWISPKTCITPLHYEHGYIMDQHSYVITVFQISQYPLHLMCICSMIGAESFILLSNVHFSIHLDVRHGDVCRVLPY